MSCHEVSYCVNKSIVSGNPVTVCRKFRWLDASSLYSAHVTVHLKSSTALLQDGLTAEELHLWDKEHAYNTRTPTCYDKQVSWSWTSIKHSSWSNFEQNVCNKTWKFSAIEDCPCHISMLCTKGPMLLCNNLSKKSGIAENVMTTAEIDCLVDGRQTLCPRMWHTYNVTATLLGKYCRWVCSYSASHRL